MAKSAELLSCAVAEGILGPKFGQPSYYYTIVLHRLVKVSGLLLVGSYLMEVINAENITLETNVW